MSVLMSAMRFQSSRRNFLRYKTINIFRYIQHKYFKNNNCLSSILNLFFFCQLMRLFRKDFQRNVLHSIQNAELYKGIQTHVYFILGNNSHA